MRVTKVVGVRIVRIWGCKGGPEALQCSSGLRQPRRLDHLHTASDLQLRPILTISVKRMHSTHVTRAATRLTLELLLPGSRTYSAELGFCCSIFEQWSLTPARL